MAGPKKKIPKKKSAKSKATKKRGDPKRRTTTAQQGTLLDVSHSKDEKLNGLARQYKESTAEYSSWGAKVRTTRAAVIDRMEALKLKCYDDGDVRVDLKHKDDGIAVKLYDVEG